MALRKTGPWWLKPWAKLHLTEKDIANCAAEMFGIKEGGFIHRNKGECLTEKFGKEFTGQTVEQAGKFGEYASAVWEAMQKRPCPRKARAKLRSLNGSDGKSKQTDVSPSSGPCPTEGNVIQLPLLDLKKRA